MYAFAPIALAALHRIDADRPRSYRVPLPAILLPTAFCSANRIIYWGGFDITWKLACAIVVGLLLFGFGAWRAGTGTVRTLWNALWIAPWLSVQVLIGWLGRYGNGARNLLPEWLDIATVIVFALLIFYWAVAVANSKPEAAAAIDKDAEQLQSVQAA